MKSYYTTLHIFLLMFFAFACLNHSQAQCPTGGIVIENLSTGTKSSAYTSASTINLCIGTKYKFIVVDTANQITWGTNTFVDSLHNGAAFVAGSGINGTTGTTDIDTVWFSITTSGATISFTGCTYTFTGLAAPTITMGLTGTIAASSYCFGSSAVVTASCSGAGVGACTGLTYAFSHTGGASTGTSSPFTIPSLPEGSYTATVEMKNGNADATSATAYCRSTSSINFDIIRKPDLTAFAFGTGTSTNSYTKTKPAEICIDGTQQVNATCSNCMNTDAYTWQQRPPNGNANSWVALGAAATLPGNTASSGTPALVIDSIVIDPESTPYSAPLLAPGVYDIRVIATTAGGCKDTISSALNIGGDLRINDRPDVMIIYNNGTATFPSNNSQVVCTGSVLTLRQNGCDDPDFILADMSFPNNSSNQTDPNRNLSYADPCSGDYMRKLTWGAIAQDGTDLTNTMNTGGTPANVKTTFTNAADREVVLTTTQTGGSNGVNVVTYVLEAEAMNGCINRDSMKITTQDATIVFEYPTGTSVGANPTIPICPGTTPTVRAVCATCGNNKNYTWSVVSGPGTITSGGSSQDMVAGNITGTTIYKVEVSGNSCKGEGRVTVTLGSGPTLNLAVVRTCSNEELLFKNNSHQGGQTYVVYDGDPAGTPSVVPSSTSNDTIRVPHTLAAGNYTYWVVATLGTCTVKASINFTVRQAPYFDNTKTTVDGTSWPPYHQVCNNAPVKFEAKATGGVGTLNYVWTATGTPATPNTPMGTASSGGGGGGYYTWVFSGWFPTLIWVPFVAGENSYTFDADHPQQIWNSAALPSATVGAGLSLVVTDQTTGCRVTEDWRFDILQCGKPILSKNYSIGQNGTKSPFQYYACVNEYVHLEVDIPVASGSSLDYTPVYEWRQESSAAVLSTDTIFSYQATSARPDTVYTICIVYKDTSKTNYAGVVFDTTILSRNDINVFPDEGSTIGQPDTVVCLNEWVEGQANCPGCRSRVKYRWDSSPISDQPNGNIWNYQNYQGTNLSGFTILLSIAHGEHCSDTIIRDVDVNPLPTVSLSYRGGAVSSTNPIYLCSGEVDTISVNISGCPSCASSSYVWNTGANTQSISVSNQGGYYAQVIDTNFCKGATNYAIVIEANEGLNSPAIANPTQLCNGGSTTLEVAPCSGCSYTWHNVTPMPIGTQIATTRTHVISTTGNYYAEVTNTQGCVYPTSQVSVTTTTLTVPSIAGTADSLCEGEIATLSTTVVSGASYQWYKNGSILSGATNSTYSASDSGGYTIRVTHPNGCIRTSPIFRVYKVTFKPDIIAIDTVICSATTADLMTNLNAGWQYQWFDDGNPIVGATASVYSATTPGSHYVQVTTNYGCIIRSDSVNIYTSSLPIPQTSTSTPSVCPGEYGKVSVSLCTGCSYQWFNANTGLSITTDAVGNYRYDSIVVTQGLPNNFYCLVSANGCIEQSDTVTIIYNSIFTPAINTSSNVVCDGQSPLLITPRCTGCSYSWLLDSVPVLGALNDTFHYVTNPKDSGYYQIAVTYSNGCSDTSAVLKISDGSYNLNLAVQSVPADYIICNGVGEDLLATSTSTATGTFFYTLFLNNTPVTGYTNVTSNNFPDRDVAGVYTVQSIDPRNCKELSNFISLDTVIVQPVLDARATSNPSSVDASAICRDTGSVFLEVTNCVGCSFSWELNGSPIVGWTFDTLTSQAGPLGTGTYIVNAVKNGCSAPSNPTFVANLISTTPSSLATTTKNSICDGESVLLEHIASNGNPTLNCPGCSFRWLRASTSLNSGNPINGASNYQYVAGTLGYYYLEMTTAQGCVDTSQVVVITKVDPPVGFVLNFDSVDIVQGTGTPLASNGTPIDMNYWVYPASVRYSALTLPDTSYFTNSPFSGTLLPNAGLSGIGRISFTPDDTLSGNHLITYHYITQGCEFTVQDVLEVLPPADITVTNANLASVPYEACVGDQLTISTTNLNFPVYEVYAFNDAGTYIKMPISSVTVSSDTFGVSVRWNSTLVFTVPGSANASYLMLVDSVGNDTTYTSFVLIHNTDLSFTGLPNMLCSNGTPITLFGNPAGGTFTVRDTTPAHNTYAGVVTSGNVLNPTLIPTSLYINGSQMVDVFYAYTETYTNGNLCPSFDTVSQRMEVKDVRLTSVQFNTISVSQNQELLTNLVRNVIPYRARANKPNYTVSFAGSFTFPAGNPTHFLPKNAGIGSHPLTYKIQSGDCINSVTSNITVKAAPTPIPMPDTICRNHGIVNYSRAMSVPGYKDTLLGTVPVNATTTYTDTLHIMKVYSVNSNQGITWNNTNAGSENFNYNPSLVTGNYDTIVVEYWFSRKEDTTYIPGPTTANFDNLSYVIGRVYKPIYIEDLNSVAIDTSIVKPFYCQANTLHLLAGNPTNNAYGGGRFMLYGGNGQYALPAGDTLMNNVINPYQVNSSSSPNGVYTYDLVYILNGAVCKNSDTMQITISKLLTPSFATINGKDEFCDTDPNVTILHNVMAPDTAIWKIGGVPQASYVFPPNPLDPGTHVVELQMKDIFGCTATAKDTFFINPLPQLDTTPALASHYCANDPVLNFVVSPSPSCPSYMSPGHIQLNERFNSGLPPNWNFTSVVSGKPWIATNILPEGGTGTAAFVDTSQVPTDSWLMTSGMSMVAGHTYRLTYMVRAGALDPTCSGLCDASLVVSIGTAQNITAMGAQIDYQAAINNDQTYVRYEVEHYHDPLLGFTTGTYYLGFRANTPAKGRSLRLDNVRMRDLNIENCNLNGIGYVNGPGVHNVLDSLYQFNPLSVTPGNIEVKYIYTTVKGCQDSLVIPITVDSFPIVSFTNMDSSYCLNEPTVMLTGSPLGGRFTKTLYSPITGDSNLVHVPFTAPLDTAWYPVNYQTNVPGVDIVSYTFTDRNGCSSTARDTVVIVPMLDSAAINYALDPSNLGHCENGPPKVINVVGITGAPYINSTTGAAPPGKFYGAGVRNGLAGPGVAMFHPDSAVLDMGHIGDVVITYIYPTTTNCIDTTRFTTHVHALPDLTFANLPDSLCLNRDTFQLLAINNVVTGSMGQITYQDTLIQRGTYAFTDVFGNGLPNFIGLFDRIRPYEAAGLSQVNVQYTHTTNISLGGCTSTVYDSIRIDSVPIVYFQGMKPYYCENEPPSILLAFPPYKVGSGYMMLDSVIIDSSFYWIDPSVMVGAGSTTHVYPSYYTYTDSRGCRGEVYDTFEVRPIPIITFSPTFQDTFCRQPGSYHNLMEEIVSPKGGFFTDNLALTSIVNDSLLDLGSIAGPRLVTYNFVDTTTVCYNNDSIWLYLFNGPQLDFEALGGCSAMDITFDGYASNLVYGIDSITRIWWVFDSIGAPNTIVTSPLDTSPVTLPDIIHQYVGTGTYKASLFVENQGNCVASISKDIIISPTVAMLPTPYFEDFNATDGSWYADKPVNVSSNNIWAYQSSLSGAKINSSNGAWVTAGDTLYGKGQKGWVYSPCFDFSTAQRTMIAFDLWRDMLSGIDGVVMEYYDGGTNSWQLVGDKDLGINWYQSNFVLARPGNQQSVTYPKGWTGRGNGFESARFKLDQFKGKNHVRFRVAFSSSLQTVNSATEGAYEGVAFDNVWVGERTRNVLVEHFNNFNYVTPGGASSDAVDLSVYNKIFNSAYGLDVLLLQYQTAISSPTLDLVNLRNSIDPAARVYLYKLTDDNQVVVDGRTIGTGVSQDLNTYDLDYDMLQFPDFNISISTPSIVNNVLSVNSTVTSTRNVPQEDFAVHTIVIQDSMTINPRGFEMLSVVCKMVPNAGGETVPLTTYQNQQWPQGVAVNVGQSWDFTSKIGQASFNPNQLEVVVFVQNMQTKEILQAQTTQDLTKYTGTGKLEDQVEAEILDLKVYPNPSSNYFNVEFDKELEGTYNWRLVDVTGRILQNGTAEQGTRNFTIDANQLTNGAYFFVISNDKMYAQRKLVVIK